MSGNSATRTELRRGTSDVGHVITDFRPTIPNTSTDKLLIEAEKIMPEKLFSFLKKIVTDFKPYAELAREAKEADRRDPNNATSVLALTEILASTEHVYATSWDNDGFKGEGLSALSKLLSNSTNNIEKTQKIASLIHNILAYANKENPLIAMIALELLDIEEEWHVQRIRGMHLSEPSKIANHYETERTRAAQKESLYRRTTIHNIAKALGIQADIGVGNGVHDITVTDKETSEAEGLFNAIRWTDVYDILPGQNTENKRLYVRNPKKSSALNVHALFLESPTLHEFFIYNNNNEKIAKVEIIRPNKAYEYFRIHNGLPDALVSLRIKSAYGGEVCIAEISRFSGAICSPYRNLVSLETALGYKIHDRIRNTILRELVECITAPKTQPSVAISETPTTPPMEDIANEPPHTHSLGQSEEAPTTPAVHVQKSDVQNSCPDTTKPKKIPLPHRMKTSQIITTLQRVDPVIKVFHSRHWIIQRTLPNGHILTSTLVNDHGNDKRYVPYGIIEDILNTLQMDPLAFLQHTHGSQAKSLIKQLEKAEKRASK